MAMTERRCMAIGRGPKETPHFYAADIDTHDLVLADLVKEAGPAMVIRTLHGYHVMSPEPITSPYILGAQDPKCPTNAIRVYPFDDLELVKRPTTLCIRTAKIYEAIFKLPKLPEADYLPCGAPWHIGVYVAVKDGIKQTGEGRIIAPA